MSDKRLDNNISHIDEGVKDAKSPILSLRKTQLLEKANSLPKSPGCYLMLNRYGEVIYVGKAKSLKDRVTSYFNQSAKSAKTQILVSHIRNFDFILTGTDVESYVLENNLIKEYKPKYNIRLKDDKSYPYVSVNFNEDFPRLEYVRRPKRKQGVTLFGPFPVGSQISKTIRTLTKAFQLRDCSKSEFNNRSEPCILFQMKQCSAPCVDLIFKDKYLVNLKSALAFFEGPLKAKKALKTLESRMHHCAENEDFEQAAMIRDYIIELTDFQKNCFDQNVELSHTKNIDIISYYCGDSEVDISFYLIRKGTVLGHKVFHFALDEVFEVVEEEALQFILQYYAQTDEILPEAIAIDFEEEYFSIFSKSIETLMQKKIKVFSRTGDYSKLLATVNQHARENQRVRLEAGQSPYVGLRRLQELLSLKERPQTLECYDIAIWQGKSPTASQVVFHNGKPEKKDYRYYHLQERPEGNNDFAMMKEVFERRLKKGALPDVFVVDGGVAQVNTVSAVLEENNCFVPVVGIAKSRDLTKGKLVSKNVERSDERLIIAGRANPYILSKCPSLFRIIVQLRDEAHRFSRKLHHKAEKKRVFSSWIDAVDGLGEKTKMQIRKNLGVTVDELRSMNAKDIQAYLGISLKYARLIYEYLKTN